MTLLLLTIEFFELFNVNIGTTALEQSKQNSFVPKGKENFYNSIRIIADG